MEHHQFDKTIEKILLFWGQKGGLVIFGVIMFSFLFVMFFGNYPQWKEKEYKQALKQYFEPELENVIYEARSTYNFVIKLYFTYSDGTDLSLTDYKRPNRQEISNNWKMEILNLVCSRGTSGTITKR
ncbi:hypothetical protein [Alteromonas hispanica]|uniref:Uncharacterized protein n=1 Tax=Alteromonas hispanica TaxID=315421 RepID=A0A6L9MPP6_9ALTE|nr:hypothetical protein [Alteromonas hispanica]NDW20182.1 hypothetical protein [Alteromonas hispanica]